MSALATATLQSLSQLLLWVGAIASGIAVVAGLASAIFANKATDRVQIDANKRIADANATAAGAADRAAKANERAATLEKEAAELRLEAEKLKERIAWRELTPQQSATFTEALRGAVGVQIEMGWIATDAEAASYAEQIMGAITAAGVRVNGNPTIFTGPVVGLRMSQTTSPAADRLRHALTAAEIPFTYSGATPELRMSVGNKPRGNSSI